MPLTTIMRCEPWAVLQYVFLKYVYRRKKIHTVKVLQSYSKCDRSLSSYTLHTYFFDKQ